MKKLIVLLIVFSLTSCAKGTLPCGSKYRLNPPKFSK